MIHIIQGPIRLPGYFSGEAKPLESVSGGIFHGRSGRPLYTEVNNGTFVAVAPNTICWSNWSPKKAPAPFFIKNEDSTTVIIPVPGDGQMYVIAKNEMHFICYNSKTIETIQYLDLEYNPLTHARIGLKFENGEYVPFIASALAVIPTAAPEQLEETAKDAPTSLSRKYFELPSEVFED